MNHRSIANAVGFFLFL